MSPAIFLVTIKKGGEKWKRPPIVLQLGGRGELKESTYQSACAILSWKWANKLNQHGFLQESKLLFAFYKLMLLCGQRNRTLNLKSLP